MSLLNWRKKDSRTSAWNFSPLIVESLCQRARRLIIFLKTCRPFTSVLASAILFMRFCAERYIGVKRVQYLSGDSNIYNTRIAKINIYYILNKL